MRNIEIRDLRFEIRYMKTGNRQEAAGNGQQATGNRQQATAGTASAFLLILGMLAVTAGCRPPTVTFPDEPMARSAERIDYDTDGDGRADFSYLLNAAGRADRIAYTGDGAGRPERVVNLDAIQPDLARHLVIVLDGFPLEVVREFVDAGHFRLCHPPQTVISPYPSMTDLALGDEFRDMPAEGYEAKYYSLARQKVVGGVEEYLAGKNEPVKRFFQWRQATILDAVAYIKPGPLFGREVHSVKRLWDKRRTSEVICYLVTSATMGSRLGKDGQLACLRRVEQLVNQVVCESSGVVKVTIFADHGQTNVPCRPAELDDLLRQKGWRPVKRLARDKDVALVEFGLVTFAAMNTRRPAALAAELIADERIALASCVEGDEVIVMTRGGKASIRSADGKTFQYKRTEGDPLKLGRDGEFDGRKQFAADAASRAEYPDALYRLWRAHRTLVNNPADVLVSLDDRYCAGRDAFSGLVDMASTHGGLNWANSATFIMSSAGAIDSPLRGEDVSPAIGRLFGRPFPLGR